MARRGLSLIEILIVVAIVGALVGMALPAIGLVRRTAGLIACRSHLGECGTTIVAYAADHGGTIPAASAGGIDDPQRSVAWFHRLPAYLDRRDVRGPGIFQCARYAWRGPQVFTNACPKSFKMNATLTDDPAHVARLEDVEEARRTVLFIDAIAGETGMGQWGHAVPSAVDLRRHDGRANVLYADLHADAVRLDAVARAAGALRWDNRPGRP